MNTPRPTGPVPIASQPAGAEAQSTRNTRVMDETETAWDAALRPAGCPACRQAFLAPPSLLLGGANPPLCPLCAGPLEPQPVRLRVQAPERAIPFRLSKTELQSVLAAFVKSVWIRYDDFTAEKLMERIQPLYLPMWLVDSDLSGSWQAEMGYVYQVKSTREAYANNAWQTTELLEDRMRWEARLGQIDLHYDNTLTPALSSHDAWTRRVGSFSPELAQPFRPRQSAGVMMQLPDLDTDEAWPLAKDQIDQRVSVDCLQAAGAATLRRFSARLSCTALNWTQLLLPVYSTWYADDDGRRHVIHINGQSGKTGGARLASQKKGLRWAVITAAVGLGLFLLAMPGFLLEEAFPPAGAVADAAAFLSLLVLAAAAVPALWPWHWNRAQRRQL